MRRIFFFFIKTIKLTHRNFRTSRHGLAIEFLFHVYSLSLSLSLSYRVSSLSMDDLSRFFFFFYRWQPLKMKRSSIKLLLTLVNPPSLFDDPPRVLFKIFQPEGSAYKSALNNHPVEQPSIKFENSIQSNLFRSTTDFPKTRLWENISSYLFLHVRNESNLHQRIKAKPKVHENFTIFFNENVS